MLTRFLTESSEPPSGTCLPRSRCHNGPGEWILMAVRISPTVLCNLLISKALSATSTHLGYFRKFQAPEVTPEFPTPAPPVLQRFPELLPVCRCASGTN